MVKIRKVGWLKSVIYLLLWRKKQSEIVFHSFGCVIERGNGKTNNNVPMK